MLPRLGTEPEMGWPQLIKGWIMCRAEAQCRQVVDACDDMKESRGRGRTHWGRGRDFKRMVWQVTVSRDPSKAA